MDFQSALLTCRNTLEKKLDSILPKEDTPPDILSKALRYGCLGGGKRLRGFLCVQGSEIVSKNVPGVIDFACAIEMIHAYSLVHDDLPCMDNADMRRGKPSLHKAFNEHIAVLAGDALLTYAFEVMSKAPVKSGETAIACISDIARAIGTEGMIAGQVLDMDAANASLEEKLLKEIHLLKTGKLIQVSPLVGARLAGADQNQSNALSEYGIQLGLAFQITDDLLDVLGSAEETGKDSGHDSTLSKLTYPAVYGIEKSGKMAEEAVNKAIEAVDIFQTGAKGILQDTAKAILTRRS